MSDDATEVAVGDLSDCDREPIHIPGRIQTFGYLVAVTSEWMIAHSSANLVDLFGDAPDGLVGRPLAGYITADALHDIRARVQTLVGPDSVERLFRLQLVDGPELYDVAVHRSDGSVVVEIEPHPDDDVTDPMRFVRPMVERIRGAETIEQLCRMATRQLRALTTFDRVMTYRFAADGSGTVVAEAKSPEMEPFLGLRYPASDIPSQALALYRRTVLRIISDVNDPGVPVEPVADPEGNPLDLSLSVTRAVSPVHIEYLRNMGVGASMSVSILRGGELWGLFACHHRKPKVISYEQRSAVELFGEMFSLILDQKESEIERGDLRLAGALHDELTERLSEAGGIAGQIDVIAEAIRPAIAFDGIACWVGGEYAAAGRTPNREQFTMLLPFLNAAGARRAQAYGSLSRGFPPAVEYADQAAGALVVPISRIPQDYVVLFRQEVVRTVTWAGRPQAAVDGPNSLRLSPRKSFDAWRETVRHQSEPWSESEVRVADQLRVTLLEVVLRMTDQQVLQHREMQDRQAFLIAELNHRVRNILNLIRGLVGQSIKDAVDVDSLAAVIGNRVHALARAHDQIIQHHGGPAPLRMLIEAEADAYAGGRTDRVVLSGPDVLLQPVTYSTLSLVIHEMVTNAVKYGALSNPQGSVQIELEYAEGGPLTLHWRERGGPEVRRPNRRGFGSTITERSIPHELGGSAEITYAASGLEAAFVIPADYVLPMGKRDVLPLAAREPVPVVPIIDGSVLIVDDNLVIAVDAEDAFRALGIEDVRIAGSVQEALDAIDGQQALRFVLLDIQLGRETSEAVARRLQDDGIVFAFATGYGERHVLADAFPDTLVLQKPFDAQQLSAVLAQVLGTAGA